MAKRPFQKGGVFNGADPLVFARAKELRNSMTDAENVLWNYLKSGVSGLKFRRQHPLGCYIADFYCHQVKLVIEIDGSIHQSEDVKKHDEHRTNDLERNGYRVIRFTNQQVLRRVEDVMKRIELTIENCLSNHY